MKEFLFPWATEHWFLTFILLWMVLGCVQRFLGIFHRNPVIANEEQITQMETRLYERLEESARTRTPPGRRTTATPAASGKPWHERLDQD